MIYRMDRGSNYGLMDHTFKEILKMGYVKVLVNTRCILEHNIMVNGSKVN